MHRWINEKRKSADFVKPPWQAWDMHLDCYTQQQIADEIGVEQKTISNWISNFRTNSEFTNPPGKTDKQPWGNVQYFDSWNFAKANGDSDYFGQMPPQEK